MCIKCVWALTQREASVQLQVGSEESSQAAEQLATGLPSVQLVAAVDQTVGRAAVVRLVQNPHQQLALTNHHLRDGERRVGSFQHISFKSETHI